MWCRCRQINEISHVPDRALETVDGSITCLESSARSANADNGKDDLESFSRAHGFDTWSALHAFIRESAILLDKHTAQITRVLPTDMQTAWEFLADPQKLATWMFPAEFEAKPGASFKFAPEGWHGKIGIFENGRELRFDAVTGGWTWFSLELVDGKTVFKLRDYMAPQLVIPADARSDSEPLTEDQPGGEGTHWQGVLSGWHCGVDDLRGEFSGEKTRWDYGALTRLYKILIEDYHRPS